MQVSNKKTKFNIHRCLHEDGGSIGDIFATAEIVVKVSNMCIGYVLDLDYVW